RAKAHPTLRRDKRYSSGFSPSGSAQGLWGSMSFESLYQRFPAAAVTGGLQPDRMKDDGIATQQHRIGGQLLGPAVSPASLWSELCKQANQRHDGPIQPLIGLLAVAVNALDRE